jgi:polysaccharide export outer membrane protein
MLRSYFSSLLILLLAACNTVAEAPSLAIPGNTPEALPVVLAPGTEIQVRFYYTPELDELQTIAPDGTLSLALIGQVEAAGKTTPELLAELRRRYEPHLKQPEINVVVRSQPERSVVVGGLVVRPGLVPFVERLSLLEAVLMAGGPDYSEGNVRNVIVVRIEDGVRVARAFDLKPALTGKHSEPFWLRPRDIVLVPRTETAEMAQWVETNINRMIPRLPFIYTYDFGNASVGVDLRTERF